ncbi:putative adenylate kinase [Thermococcus cleftensis]|uniref:Adenylate kinase n=1 Tax=Thermococcus cleftensis (strain DSM 27260 / KACC 17922 / CL1) TaxID=163003 RepID=I3ZWL0_THECF|nr:MULTISPECIES: adenylate kinase [Thermococcus]AFL96094.1 putative adenylate kinase [Thermococcus cleftensis]NJE02908.1 adenylate kinase [Thermococcus sp. MV11]
MNVLIFGPPGSGKSTHSRTITERYGLTYVSSGDLIRAEIERGSELGRELEEYLARGELIPDTVINTLIISRLRRHRRNFLIDGYPRTPAQVLALEEYLYDHGMTLDVAMEIFITKEESVERIAGRRVCPRCGAVYHVKYNPPRVPGKCDLCGAELVRREDDRPEVVERRYDLYLKNMEPIIKFYKRQGIYVRIDGHDGIPQVWERIRPLLDYISSRESFRGRS